LLGFPLHSTMHSSWHCSTFLYVVRFPFSLLLSFSHCLTLLFTLLSYFKYKLFVLLFSSSHYFAFLFALLLLVCCYLLKNLIAPPCIPSCRNWEWLGIKNWKPIFFQ
jgi:hypothetical protein